MTDIVVTVDVRDNVDEIKFFEVLDKLVSQAADFLDPLGTVQAPDIMVKSKSEGLLTEKLVIFQCQRTADQFVRHWQTSIGSN